MSRSTLTAAEGNQLFVPRGLRARFLHARAQHAGHLQGQPLLLARERARPALGRPGARDRLGGSRPRRRCCPTRTGSSRSSPNCRPFSTDEAAGSRRRWTGRDRIPPHASAARHDARGARPRRARHHRPRSGLCRDPARGPDLVVNAAAYTAVDRPKARRRPPSRSTRGAGPYRGRLRRSGDPADPHLDRLRL